MKFIKFIEKLEEIKNLVKNLDEIEVKMADNLLVKDILLINKNIYITDMINNKNSDN